MTPKKLLFAACAALLVVSNVHAAVNRDTAEQIALRQVPGANIVGGGLEKVRGRLVWTFELATPQSRNFTEVAIDHETGKVLTVRLETPAEQVDKTQPL